MTAPPAPTPPADRSPGAVMRWCYDVVNTHTAEPLRAVLDEHSRDRFPTGTRRGADGIVAWFADLFAAVPDVTVTIEGMVSDGEQVFVRWRLAGTHTGAPFEGFAPSGRRIDLDGVDHAVVRDGVIASNFVVFDRVQLARQLGLVPAEGSRVDVVARRAMNLLLRRRG